GAEPVRHQRDRTAGADAGNPLGSPPVRAGDGAGDHHPVSVPADRYRPAGLRDGRSELGFRCWPLAVGRFGGLPRKAALLWALDIPWGLTPDWQDWVCCQLA